MTHKGDPVGQPMTEGDILGGSGAMFDRIAGRYDLLNRLQSFGMDQGWRRRALASLQLKAGDQLLDLATGTADLAIMAAHRVPDLEVVGVDPSPAMLEVGRSKVDRADLSPRVQLIEGDAQSLPFETDTFDGVSIAWGIRNVADRQRALREMNRVLRPGGRLAILEGGEPEGFIVGPTGRFYMHHILPQLGALLSGAQEYKYLPDSIAQFPKPSEFCGYLEQAGFTAVEHRPLTFGAARLYTGRCP